MFSSFSVQVPGLQVSWQGSFMHTSTDVMVSGFELGFDHTKGQYVPLGYFLGDIFHFRGSLKHRENLQFFFHCFHPPLPFLWFVLHRLTYLRYHFAKRLPERGFVSKRKNYLVFKHTFVMVLTYLERNLHYLLHGIILEWACYMFTRAWREHEMLSGQFLGKSRNFEPSVKVYRIGWNTTKVVLGEEESG